MMADEDVRPSTRHPCLASIGFGSLMIGILLALAFMTFAWLMIGGVVWIATAIVSVMIDIAKGERT
jgi:hypothetical protein